MNLTDDVFYDILLDLDYDSIKKYCLSNKSINLLCNNQNFWRNKFNRDYPSLTIKSTNWKKEYNDIYNAYKKSN